MWYQVAAEIPGHGCSPDNVGCFDPTVVVARLKQAFPEAVVGSEDLAWRDYEGLRRNGAAQGTVRTAEDDARRRGPIWAFEIPTADGRTVRGRAERYVVKIGGADPIPDDLKGRFVAFLETLRFAPFVEIASVRIEGNDRCPA